MSNLSEIRSILNTIEESVSKKFEEMQEQVTNAGSSKDTVAKIADELRRFREITFGILTYLRNQIDECANRVDELETRSRRKALLISGVPEKANENCVESVLQIFKEKLCLSDMSKSHIKVCHRLGSTLKDRPRPILIRFTSVDSKYMVWKVKTKLKGSTISLKEFLTKSRQSVFARSRFHFGMRSVWTQGGIIIVKTPDGTRQKITTQKELAGLITKYPKVPAKSKT